MGQAAIRGPSTLTRLILAKPPEGRLGILTGHSICSGLHWSVNWLLYQLQRGNRRQKESDSFNNSSQ